MHRVSRARLAEERTALSPRPKRVRGRRHAHRRGRSGAGAVMVPVAAVAAVVVVAIGAYVLMSAAGSAGRLTQAARAATAATVSVEARHAVAGLEQERQQMIAMDEASRSTHVLVAPKLASTAAPVMPKRRRQWGPAAGRPGSAARPGGSGHRARGGAEPLGRALAGAQASTSAAWTICGQGRAGGGRTPRTPAARTGFRRRCLA